MLVVSFWEYAAALPAFPGAEGQGASTAGGRGGAVYKVTNLNDSGPGSLRSAVDASGARIVVFDVSGYINLSSELVIRNPYITIAGQTSPGGVAVTGWTTRIYHTHDVVITHMRFRPGSHGQGVIDPDAVHAVIVEGTQGESAPAYNIVFDHCSFSYGIDETIDVAYNCHDITFSWCIIGPGLNSGHSEGAHSAGMVLWGKYATVNQVVTAHHNFFPNNHFRDPEVGSGVTADLRNNVAYNWTNALSPQFNHPDEDGGSHSFMNFVHNYSKPGPDSNECGTASSEMFFCDSLDPESKCHAQTDQAYRAIYYQGNLGCSRTSQADPEWQIITGWSPFNLLTADWQSPEPFPVNDIPVTTTPMSKIYAEEIVASAGATMPLRDSEDAGAAADFLNGTEFCQPLDLVYPDDFPVFSAPAAPADMDNDGMADTWEISQGLNISINDSAGDRNNDGYTNIEEYLHYKAGYVPRVILLSAPRELRVR